MQWEIAKPLAHTLLGYGLIQCAPTPHYGAKTVLSATRLGIIHGSAAE